MTALAQAVKDLEAEFGKGSLQRLGSREVVPIESISTGALTLDLALGIGGVPKGRIVEIYGAESAGKTTLVYHLIANAQAKGGTCAFIDAEHAFDPIYAKAVGVDTDNLYINQPDYGEQGLEIVDRLVKTGEVSLVAVDSVAALTPRAILEGEMGDATVALLARLMSQSMSKLAGNANRSGTCVVFTNQLRENVNMTGFGSREFQPGGRALKFYASQRLDIRRIETLKDKDGSAFGHRARIKVVKNKLARPHTQAEVVIRYGTGLSQEDCLLDLGLDLNLIDRAGSFLSVPGLGKVQGREKAVQALRDDDSASQAMAEMIGEAFNA